MAMTLPIGVRIDEETDTLIRAYLRDAVALCLAYSADNFDHLDEVKEMVEKAPNYPGEIGKRIFEVSYPRGYTMGYLDASDGVSDENRKFLSLLMGVEGDNIDVDGRFDDVCSTLLAAADTPHADPLKSGRLVDGLQEALHNIYETGYFYGTRDAKTLPDEELDDKLTEFREGIMKLYGDIGGMLS